MATATRVIPRQSQWYDATIAEFWFGAGTPVAFKPPVAPRRRSGRRVKTGLSLSRRLTRLREVAFPWKATSYAVRLSLTRGSQPVS